MALFHRNFTTLIIPIWFTSTTQFIDISCDPFSPFGRTKTTREYQQACTHTGVLWFSFKKAQQGMQSRKWGSRLYVLVYFEYLSTGTFFKYLTFREVSEKQKALKTQIYCILWANAIKNGLVTCKCHFLARSRCAPSVDSIFYLTRMFRCANIRKPFASIYRDVCCSFSTNWMTNERWPPGIMNVLSDFVQK